MHQHANAVTSSRNLHDGDFDKDNLQDNKAQSTLAVHCPTSLRALRGACQLDPACHPAANPQPALHLIVYIAVPLADT